MASDYLFLFRGGDPDPSLTPEQMQAHMAKWGRWIGDLRERGKFKAGDPLESAGKVLSGPAKAVSDGPFAEAKDVVGGYLMVIADSLDDATELARGCPGLEDGGTVEVRAIRPM